MTTIANRIQTTLTHLGYEYISNACIVAAYNIEGDKTIGMVFTFDDFSRLYVSKTQVFAY